jgi:hypothetical protein
VKDHAPLEDVGVLLGVFRGGLGMRQVEGRAQFGEKELVVLALGAAGIRPTAEKFLDICRHGVRAMIAFFARTER